MVALSNRAFFVSSIPDATVALSQGNGRMSKAIAYAFFGLFSSFVLADEVSDNFKLMAEAADVAAAVGEKCIAEHKATKSQAQCEAFDKAWNDFRHKQQAWQESFNQNGAIAQASASAQEHAAFQANILRINPVLIYISSHEDALPSS